MCAWYEDVDLDRRLKIGWHGWMVIGGASSNQLYLGFDNSILLIIVKLKLQPSKHMLQGWMGIPTLSLQYYSSHIFRWMFSKCEKHKQRPMMSLRSWFIGTMKGGVLCFSCCPTRGDGTSPRLPWLATWSNNVNLNK